MNDSAAIDIVTGIRYYDDNGAAIGKTGNPNILNNDDLKVFPNPINGALLIQGSKDELIEFWIIEAKKDTTFTDIEYASVDLNYPVHTLDDKKLFYSKSESGSSLVDFIDFNPGYFRLIVKDEDQNTLIENIYYDPTKSGNEMIAFLNDAF